MPKLPKAKGQFKFDLRSLQGQNFEKVKMVRELLVAASYRRAVNPKVKQGQSLTNQIFQNRPFECDSVDTPMEVCVAFL